MVERRGRFFRHMTSSVLSGKTFVGRMGERLLDVNSGRRTDVKWIVWWTFRVTSTRRSNVSTHRRLLQVSRDVGWMSNGTSAKRPRDVFVCGVDGNKNRKL